MNSDMMHNALNLFGPLPSPGYNNPRFVPIYDIYIVDVRFNGPATIVFYKKSIANEIYKKKSMDDKIYKSVVKRDDSDLLVDDYCIGYAMAICKMLMNSKNYSEFCRSNVDPIKQATALAKKRHVYGFDFGMRYAMLAQRYYEYISNEIAIRIADDFNKNPEKWSDVIKQSWKNIGMTASDNKAVNWLKNMGDDINE